MSQPGPPASPVRQPRWRARSILLLVGLSVLLIGGTGIGLYLYHAGAADAALSEAFAEADRLDPGWRLEELEARRATVPEKENSALQVIRAKKLIPQNWGADERFSNLFLDLYEDGPERQLNAEQLKALRAELARAPAALAEARKLKDLPRGRFPITYTRDWISTLRPNQDAREVGNLLEQQALLQAQEGSPDEALESGRAIVNCARSQGDEPFLITHLVRISLLAVARGSMERTLAQGEPSEPALRALQRLLEEEESQSLLLNAVRGERAGLDRMMEAAQAGEGLDTLEELGKWGDKKARSPHFAEILRNSPLGIKHQRAAALRYMNQLVEAAKLPWAKQAERWRELDADIQKQPDLVRLLVPACSKVAAAERRTRAWLRSAIAALATERFRRERSRWPAGPAELTAAGYLKAWPEDPSNGAPLRFKRLKDGVVIYALGPDGKDNGGKLHYVRDEVPGEPEGQGGLDYGFRLWDVPHRRQPPLPPRPKDPMPGEEGPDMPPEEKGP
jgi:hypothetical protein